MSRFWKIVFAVMASGLILLIALDFNGALPGLDKDSLAGLLYLGVLGAVIGAGVVGSRGYRLGDTARALALWAVIILALVAGYQYRYELQDIASRITAGLVPGSPLSIGEEGGRATVTLEKRPNGHFEARILLDGTAIDAIVDTGATGIILTARDAERAGFGPDRLRFNIPVSTANGMANAAGVTSGNVTIGGIVRKNLPLLVVEAGRLEQSLLGMNFIGSLSGFDVRGDRMILRD